MEKKALCVVVCALMVRMGVWFCVCVCAYGLHGGLSVLCVVCVCALTIRMRVCVLFVYLCVCAYSPHGGELRASNGGASGAPGGTMFPHMGPFRPLQSHQQLTTVP